MLDLLKAFFVPQEDDFFNKFLFSEINQEINDVNRVQEMIEKL